MPQEPTLDPLVTRSRGLAYAPIAKAQSVTQHRPLMWGLIAGACILAFVGTFLTTATQIRLPATPMPVAKGDDQRSAVVAVEKPTDVAVAPGTLETKKQSHVEETDILSRLKAPAKHQAIQLQAGNSQAFYVYGVGTIKDSWESLSQRAAPTRMKRAIVGDIAVLDAEVRDVKLWLTGYRQGSSRLIVLDDNEHELYDGVVYVY